MTNDATAQSAALVVEQRRDVRWLWLNRPASRNALNPALVELLSEAFTEAAGDASTRIVVVAGRGPSFCAGADLRYLSYLARSRMDPMPFLRTISTLFTQIDSLSKMVVAAVHGHVVAGGLELALVCDVVVARQGTLIGDGHIRYGLVPAGGSSVRLPLRVGQSFAQRLIRTGDLLDAASFLDCGFVHRVAPDDAFDNAVNEVVDQSRSGSLAAAVNANGLVSGVVKTQLEAALEQELRAFETHWRTHDMVGQLDAFLERSSRRHG